MLLAPIGMSVISLSEPVLGLPYCAREVEVVGACSVVVGGSGQLRGGLLGGSRSRHLGCFVGDVHSSGG